MARYNGPKARINRRLGMMVYESAGAVILLELREERRPRRGRGNADFRRRGPE